MGLGALLFLLGGLFYDKGVRWETDVITWLYIGGLALPALSLIHISDEAYIYNRIWDYYKTS